MKMDKKLSVVRAVCSGLLLILVFSTVFASEDGNSSNKPSLDPNTVKKQDEPNSPKSVRPDHSHPAFSQRTKQRAKMVNTQIRSRGVSNPNVLKAMQTVPRHSFVRKPDLRRAYKDHPLPIGLGQTISQPYIVAYMTEALRLKDDFKVLEVGTGSGYQAAVCAEVVREVYTIEILNQLADSAQKRLKELGYPNVFVKAADGYFGWQQKGPFDAIVVTCAAGFVPPPLIKQLKPGGRMIVPLGSPFGVQSLVLITKDKQENIKSRTLMPVRFVPMLGRISKSQ